MITIHTYRFEELSKVDSASNLVFVFGSVADLMDPEKQKFILQQFPKASIVFHSSQAQYFNGKIINDTVIQAISCTSTTIIAQEYTLNTDEISAYELGQKIGEDLRQGSTDLCLLFSAIKYDQGGELISGINQLDEHYFPVFGALATATSKENAVVGLNALPADNKIVVLQLRGVALKIQQAIDQSWKPFGLNYTVTEAQGDTIYKINDENAYELIRSVLNPTDDEEFERLLYSFPLEVTDGEDQFMRSYVRADHDRKYLSYAGYIPDGAKVRFMRSGIIQYLDADERVATQVKQVMPNPDLLFHVSCRSRYEILKPLAIEEAGAVEAVFPNTPTLGVYASGELLSTSSREHSRKVVLHNHSFILLALKEE